MQQGVKPGQATIFAIENVRSIHMYIPAMSMRPIFIEK